MLTLLRITATVGHSLSAKIEQKGTFFKQPKVEPRLSNRIVSKNHFENSACRSIDEKKAYRPLTTTYDPTLRPFGMDTNEYQRQLLASLVGSEEDCDANFSQENTAALVETVANAWLITADTEFKSEVMGGLKAIASLLPGRKLLKQLYDLNHCLVIERCENDGYNPNSNKIVFDPNCKAYRFIQTKSQIKIKPDGRSYMRLAHELIHALHFSESKEAYCENFYNDYSGIINETFTNMEEQITICGIMYGKLQFPICENVFRAAWGEPLRVSHRGFYLEKTKTFSTKHWVQVYLTLSKLDFRKNKETLYFRKKFANSLMKEPPNSDILEYALNEIDHILMRLLIRS